MALEILGLTICKVRLGRLVTHRSPVVSLPVEVSVLICLAGEVELLLNLMISTNIDIFPFLIIKVHRGGIYGNEWRTFCFALVIFPEDYAF